MLLQRYFLRSKRGLSTLPISQALQRPARTQSSAAHKQATRMVARPSRCLRRPPGCAALPRAPPWCGAVTSRYAPAAASGGTGGGSPPAGVHAWTSTGIPHESAHESASGMHSVSGRGDSYRVCLWHANGLRNNTVWRNGPRIRWDGGECMYGTLPDAA